MLKFRHLAPKWHEVLQEILKEDKGKERLNMCSSFESCPVTECVLGTYNEFDYKDHPRCPECVKLGCNKLIINLIHSISKDYIVRQAMISDFYKEVAPEIEKHFDEVHIK